jgi:hypothetical protein
MPGSRRKIPEPTPEQVEKIRAAFQRLREIGELFRDHDPDDSYDATDH